MIRFAHVCSNRFIYSSLARRQQRARRADAGFTLIEVLISVAILAIGFTSVLFSLTFAQRAAAESRNRAGAHEMVVGLAEVSMASRFNLNQQNEWEQPQGVANVLKLTEHAPGAGDPQISRDGFEAITNPKLYESERAAFSLLQLNTLDGTQQSTYELPIYVSADTGVIQSMNDGEALEIMARVTRRVEELPDIIPIDNAGTTSQGDALGVRLVTWELTYDYLGKTRTISSSVLRYTGT